MEGNGRIAVIGGNRMMVAGLVFANFMTELFTPRPRKKKESLNGIVFMGGRRNETPHQNEQEKARRRRQLAEGKIRNQPWPC